jgi:predicted GNAT family acetyltransferase
VTQSDVPRRLLSVQAKTPRIQRLNSVTDITIQHDSEARRFWTEVDGQVAELNYRTLPDRISIDHTGVPTAIEGRGIAGALVKAAFEYARQQGWKVIPACSYAAAYVQRHPEYADLIG